MATKSDTAGVVFAIVIVAGIAVMTAPNSKGPGLVKSITGGFSSAVGSAVSPMTANKGKG